MAAVVGVGEVAAATPPEAGHTHCFGEYHQHQLPLAPTLHSSGADAALAADKDNRHLRGSLRRLFAWDDTSNSTSTGRLSPRLSRRLILWCCRRRRKNHGKRGRLSIPIDTNAESSQRWIRIVLDQAFAWHGLSLRLGLGLVLWMRPRLGLAAYCHPSEGRSGRDRRPSGRRGHPSSSVSV